MHPPGAPHRSSIGKFGLEFFGRILYDDRLPKGSGMRFKRIRTWRDRRALVLILIVFAAGGSSSASLLSDQARPAAQPPAKAKAESTPPAKANAAGLPLRFRQFIDLTSYIIRDTEKDVFLTLANDRDRDLFVEAFWKVRDPTPGTPANEYKDEIVKRFAETNKKFKYRTVTEGWRTDQGRIYMILGPPKSVEYLEGDTEICPTEIWTYYGDTAKGLPPHFQLVFYRWRGMGEFKLYDPLADGPGRLFNNAQFFNPEDYESMYNAIYENKPDLAVVSLSIIPGDFAYGFQPSMMTPIYMAAIYDSPKKGIDGTYATHFANYRGFVSTEYLTNFIEMDSQVAIVLDPVTGLTFCDFALAPKKLSVDYYEPKDEYSSSFQIDVSLRLNDKIIFQYSKDLPLTIPADRLEETESMGVCLTDSFPVIGGKYHLTVLLRNPIGKEFSVLERDIEVAPAAAGQARLGDPVVGYRLSDTPAATHLPFQAVDKRLNVDPKNTFVTSDDIAYFFNVIDLPAELWKDGSVSIEIQGAQPANPYKKTMTIPLSGQTYRRLMSVVQSFPVAEFPPDYYSMALLLKDGQGTVLDRRAATFIVSAQKGLAHPLNAARNFSLANSFMFQYMLAAQFGQTGQDELAEAAFRKALELNPRYLQKLPEYAAFLLKLKRYDEALAVIERIKGDSKLAYQYSLAKGQALMGLGRFEEAIASLSAGNRIYNSDITLLNALGQCFYRTGKITDALTALNASLKLNPDQAEVKNLVREIEAKKRP
jgi:GWxTD domain-containing protein